MSIFDYFNSQDERFPETDWYCDGCGEYLNDQHGFDDHKYVWKCTECGFKSSISKDNIFDS
ncbi:Sec23/Sec24 zinc finger-containing protein [Streptococcus parasuis]|uniref:Sec23/Sec24 zinc finger-containing protein n=1 Tax=Streptococcus parasuis TaxID=1501662 RepID=A0A4V2HC85_9STRE|nr:Sec23/Sec24 zinc finger-containing protein [Streptococcus parasuis]